MNYWVLRNLKTQEKLTEKNQKEINKQLIKYYGTSMNYVIGQFEKTYNKLLLSIEEGKQPTPADLYKLDAYWQAQAQMRQELRKLGDKQVAALSKQFEIQFFDIYYGIAIPGEDTFTTIESQAVQQLINHIWCADGKSWSDRIWNNTELLQAELNDGLIDCVLNGRKTSDLKKILMNRFDVSYNRADALVRTEMAHIQTQAAQERYTNYGINEVEVWASKDERRCEVCGNLHRKRYRVGDKMPIPAHPRCRCTIIPVVE